MTFREIGRLADQVRRIPLETVLLLTGAMPEGSDKAKWHTAQGLLSITGPKFMNWNQGIGGGGAIDLVMHLQNLGFKAAVFWLRDHVPMAGLLASGPVPPPKTLCLPPRAERNLPRVIRYLVQNRCLPRPRIDALLQAGMLYADARANAVFLLLGEEKQPVGAELRGTTSSPWRGMASGSRKALGYFSVEEPPATTVILCESAIDAISCLAIHPGCRCISTAGATPNPSWLSSLIQPGHPVYCGFDADHTGDRMARDMIALHPAVRRLRPHKHDWNDILASSLHNLAET
jgi:hypothetical protein